MKMPHWPAVPWNKNVKYNLDNINLIVNALGNIIENLPPIIHIAGTNGKGSSVAMLRSIFTSRGYKVHAYTSPHLLHFNERIVLAGENISDDYLFTICERVRIVCVELKLEPRFFEAITAAAFIAFAETRADILILETGLGGRLDATNIVSPLISLITPISYDHMEYLGKDIKTIASEKAGIIKANTPCVISLQLPEVYEVLLDKCHELNAPAFCFGADFTIEFNNNDEYFKYITNNTELSLPMPNLLGLHQLVNASGVIASLSLINDKFKINTTEIAKGLKTCYWAGRIEKIHSSKYSHLVSDNIQIWVDGAHNPHGAKVLAEWIKDTLKEPIYLIIGMTKNRNIVDFYQHLSNLAEKVYCVRVYSEPSSYLGKEVAQKISASYPEEDVYVADNLENALSTINHTSSHKKAHIVICGSLFLVADFLKLIRPLA